jgi:hypothetical protein
MTKASVDLQTKNLASIFRGLYIRVASRLNVDPSYVSRIARGERKSEAVEAEIERETHKIIGQIKRKVKVNHKGSGRGWGITTAPGARVRVEEGSKLRDFLRTETLSSGLHVPQRKPLGHFGFKGEDGLQFPSHLQVLWPSQSPSQTEVRSRD